MTARKHVLRARTGSDGATELLAPSVGIFTTRVNAGELISSGQVIGALEVLGVSASLVVPDGVEGRVVSRYGGGRTRVPVQYGDALLFVSVAEISRRSAVEVAGAQTGSLSFDAPMSGRFYGRPSPNDPAFVSPGDTVTRGQTVGLLEVMKTFNRLVYQGDALPESAVVQRVAPADGDDVVRGDPILVLAATDGG